MKSLYNAFGGAAVIGGRRPLVDVIAVGSSGLYTSRDGLRYDRQSTIITSATFQGYLFVEATAINGIAYVPSQNGNIYTTTDFRTFTQVTIASIQGNVPSGSIQFHNGASLFKLAAYPTRIFAIGYHPLSFAGGENDRVSIWYSTDGGVNWLIFSNAIGGTHASSQCGKIIDGGDGNLYASISNAGGNPTTLVRIRISDGVITGTLLDGTASATDLIRQGDILYRVTNNTRSSVLSAWNTFIPAAILPSNFTGSSGANGIVSGNNRNVVLGRNSNTGRLQIIYCLSVADGEWSVATIPNITIGALGRSSKVASLGTDKGFVAVFSDNSNNNNSGALFSADGITWVQATQENPAFVEVARIQLNPLRAV